MASSDEAPSPLLRSLRWVSKPSSPRGEGTPVDWAGAVAAAHAAAAARGLATPADRMRYSPADAPRRYSPFDSIHEQEGLLPGSGDAGSTPGWTNDDLVLLPRPAGAPQTPAPPLISRGRSASAGPLRSSMAARDPPGMSRESSSGSLSGSLQDLFSPLGFAPERPPEPVRLPEPLSGRWAGGRPTTGGGGQGRGGGQSSPVRRPRGASGGGPAGAGPSGSELL